jgi:hypothetical protein
VKFLDRISEDEAKIIELRLLGYCRDETARALGVSQGKVSKVWATMPTCIETLIDLSRKMRKLGLLPTDALKGVNFLQLLAEHKVAPEKISLFLETVKKASIEARYQPEKVIEAQMQLAHLEDKSGKSYPEAIHEFQTLIDRIPELKKKNSRLQLKTKRNRRLRDEALKEAEMTPQELSEYRHTKAKLRECGLEMDDAYIVRKVLDNIKEAGHNPRHVVFLFKKHDSLTKSLASIERQLPPKRKELENLNRAIDEGRHAIFSLQEEKRRLEDITKQQRGFINNLNYQSYLIRNNIEELEKRRGALITWIGRKLNLSVEQIEYLRLDSEFDVMLALVDNELKDALRTRYGA